MSQYEKMPLSSVTFKSIHTSIRPKLIYIVIKGTNMSILDTSIEIQM